MGGSLLARDTCSLYQIADGSCGQSDLDCTYVKFAKAAEKALQDGTCADQGYTRQTGTQTKTYPIIGDITITDYAKELSVSAMQCPGSSAGVHCGMELTTTAAASCATVQAEIEARLAGANGWYDQHN